MKGVVSLFVALFFLCVFSSPVYAQCGGPVRSAVKKANCAVVRTVNRSRGVVRRSVCTAKCTTGTAAVVTADAVRTAGVIITKPVKAAGQCIGGQCFK